MPQNIIRLLPSCFRHRKPQPVKISDPVGVANAVDDEQFCEPQRHASGSPGFQFMSDLHLERFFNSQNQIYQPPFRIPTVATYLILAGDIGCFRHKRALLVFFQDLCDRFEMVFFVAGNHEFYRIEYQEGLETARAIAGELGDNFCLLEIHKEYVLTKHRTVVLGCTLHSEISEDIKSWGQLGDGKIEHWTPQDHNEHHRRDRDWLLERLRHYKEEMPDFRVIVVTHYPPSFEKTSHPKHRGGGAYQSYFASDTLDGYFRQEVTPHQNLWWVYGHTHYNSVQTIGGVALVSNQSFDVDMTRKFDLEAAI